MPLLPRLLLTPLLLTRAVWVDIKETCIGPIPGQLPGKVCATFKMDTCDNEIDTLVLYQNKTLAHQNVTDDRRMCQDSTEYPGCSQCVGFSDLKIRPAYSRICSEMLMTCNGFEVGKFPLDCVELGENCYKYTACGNCTETKGCGWCDDLKQCLPEDLNGLPGDKPSPFCEDCTKFYSAKPQCPRAQSSATDKESGFATFLIVMTVLISIGAFGYVLYYYYSRSAEELGYGGYSELGSGLMDRQSSQRYGRMQPL